LACCIDVGAAPRADSVESFSYHQRNAHYVQADQTKHRFRSWPLGRRLMLQQIDSEAAGRGPRSDGIPAWPRLARQRRRRREGLCLARVSSPAILVGHSYGGTLITHAGTDPRVAGLVYIAALAPDADETSQSLQAKFPTTDVFSYIEIADGRIWLNPDGVVCFAGDLPEQEQKLVWATQGVPAADLFSQKVDGTAWRSKPSWFIVATKDRTVHPDLERFVAKRMGATMVETASSHVPMLSNPALVLDVIRKAANAVQKSR
jgi:pimeloyl-ACP methyl ester carboxylesterase